MKHKLLMIDNYDSFTFNLVQYFSELGCDVMVYRNDKISIDHIKIINPNYIVISPGPCTPDEAGVSMDVVKILGGKYPILGVCLGHQSIAKAFGGKIIHANEVMHGKVSNITHDKTGLYEGIESPLSVTRYHSLIVDEKTMPKCLNITARLKDDNGLGVIMSFNHKSKPIYGVQYHPESILTSSGYQILNNFLNLSIKKV